MAGTYNVRYWAGRTPPKEYYMPPDPLNPIPCGFNLRKAIAYAKSVGKEVIQLTLSNNSMV